MSNDKSDQRMVNLYSSDGRSLKISRKASRQSTWLNNLLLESNFDNKSFFASVFSYFFPIIVDKVHSEVLEKVIEWCEHHKDDPVWVDEPNADVSKFDVQFMNVDKSGHFDILMAAYYLQIEPLQTLAAKSFANMLKGKSVEELRLFLSIKNDFTPEEKEEIQRQNAWLEDA